MQLQEERVLLRAGKVILKISSIMAIISALLLGVMMLNTVADVVGRYFFNSPIKGTYELIGMMLVIAGSFGLGYCQLNKGHIRITVISDLLPLKGQSIILLITYIIGAITTGLVCWRMSLRMWDYMFRGHEGMTAELNMPFWPFMLMMAIGFGWVCVIFLIDIYITIKELFKHGSD